MTSKTTSDDWAPSLSPQYLQTAFQTSSTITKSCSNNCHTFDLLTRGWDESCSSSVPEISIVWDVLADIFEVAHNESAHGRPFTFLSNLTKIYKQVNIIKPERCRNKGGRQHTSSLSKSGERSSSASATSIISHFPINSTACLASCIALSHFGFRQCSVHYSKNTLSQKGPSAYHMNYTKKISSLKKA